MTCMLDGPARLGNEPRGWAQLGQLDLDKKVQNPKITRQKKYKFENKIKIRIRLIMKLRFKTKIKTK